MDSSMKDELRDRRREEVLVQRLGEALDQVDPRGAEPCPDAELIAAYHERALAPQEATQCETHFAACSRCRKILAVLAASADTPLAEKEVARLGELVAGARASNNEAGDIHAANRQALASEFAGLACALAGSCAGRGRRAGCVVRDQTALACHGSGFVGNPHRAGAEKRIFAIARKLRQPISFLSNALKKQEANSATPSDQPANKDGVAQTNGRGVGKKEFG